MTPLEEYAQHSPMWAEGLSKLPERMHGGLVRYIMHGIPPGNFLIAVLKGDLFESLSRADDENRHLLWQYGNFLHNFSPLGCYGSPKHFDEWCKCGGLLGLEKACEGEVTS